MNTRPHIKFRHQALRQLNSVCLPQSQCPELLRFTLIKQEKVTQLEMSTIWAKLNDKICPIYRQFFIHNNCHFDRVYLSTCSRLYTRNFSLHPLQEFTGLVLPSSMRERHKKKRRKQNPIALRAFFVICSGNNFSAA